VSAVEPLPLPERALLARYRGTGAYTDCYSLTLTREISQAEYVEAFYTTGVFRLERFILRWLVAKPSTDAQAKLLAEGKSDGFAAWSVEDRAADQLLMCDYQQRTRSWLMSERVMDNGRKVTRLYFGSAVVPSHSRSGSRSLGFPFDAMLGFHKAYSRVLLRAAGRRLMRLAGPR
jgi:hypothetical protein